MRIVLTLFLCVAILGGVWLFTSRKPAPVAAHTEAPAEAASEVAGLVLELYATAPMGADPFALNDSGGDAPAAITVRLAQQTLASMASLEALQPAILKLPPLPRQQVELLITGTPVADDMAPRQGLQVRVVLGVTPLYETTVWSEGGLPFTATVPLDLRHAR